MILLDSIGLFFWVYMIMLFVRIAASWFPEFADQPWMGFIYFCTDPYLNIFRSIIPPLGMIDISPMVAFFCLGIIEHTLKAFLLFLLGY